LVTLTLSEAVIGSHSCSFTLDGQRHLGIAASCIIPWIKLHCRVESAGHIDRTVWLFIQRPWDIWTPKFSYAEFEIAANIDQNNITFSLQ
jgi:hypothetical protein